MFRRVAIGCGGALAVVFCISVIVVVVLIATEGSSVVLEVDEESSSVHEGQAGSGDSEGAGALTLADARKRAAEALEGDPSLCPHILGESVDIAFGTGISVEHDGNWYLRGRCSDDAYLVVVSLDEVEFKTCAAAREAGQSCQNSGWLSDSQP